MAIDVDALKAMVDIVEVVGSITPLVKRGHEWLGQCQSGQHVDEHPSMWVIPRKGLIHCFSCDWSTDVIGFVMHTQGLDFKGAAEWLGAKPTLKPALSAPPRLARPERITLKPPADAPTPDMTIRGLGAPARIWPYRDADGSILGYHARYEGPEGKEPRHWSWGYLPDQAPRWACGHWNRPRWLYGLDRLAARPTDRVIVCEGEKAADAAGRLLPGYVAVTWPGGAPGVRHADWEPLRGRTVLLWPDADEPGLEAMEQVAAILQGSLDCKVRVIDPLGATKGWDAADAELEGWDTAKVVEWAVPRAYDYPRQEPLVSPQGGAGDTLPDDRGESPPPAPARPRLAAVDGRKVADVEGEDPLPMALSEAGIAAEFVSTRCSDLRFVHEWKAWMVWTGSRWDREANRQTATDRIRAMSYGLKFRPDARHLTPAMQQKFEQKKFLFACLDLAQFDRRIIVAPKQFDADPYQLGTPAGTVDLRTGKLCEPDPADYITRTTTVSPVAGPHPLWDSVIECASGGDAEMRQFVWRWLGYVLTGSVQEEAFLFLYGKPACGKSTLVEAIANILGLPEDGGYAAKVPIDLLTESKYDRAGNAHILYGARFAFCAETEENRHWKSALLKEMTGGDTLVGERKYENVFAFKPSAKILIHGNHRPHMRTADEGLRRRMHLLEYKSDIPEDKRDLTFKARLVAEYPAILHTMIQSCVLWHEGGGLRKPQAIADTVSEYFDSEDTFGAWFEECTKSVAGAVCSSSEAYKSYQAYCDEHGERAPSHKRFSTMLKAKGFEITKSGTKRVLGLSLTADKWTGPEF